MNLVFRFNLANLTDIIRDDMSSMKISRGWKALLHACQANCLILLGTLKFHNPFQNCLLDAKFELPAMLEESQETSNL